MAAKASIALLSLAAFCLPALAHVAEKPHPGFTRFAQAPHRGQATVNPLTAPGIARRSYDFRGGLTCSAEQFDAGLGLYYLRARWYQPGSGRFWTHDTDPGFLKRPVTQHKYIYAYGDPVYFSDPSGHGYFERAGLFALAILNTPVVRQAGEFARGLLSSGTSSLLRANYYFDILVNYNPIRAQMNAVASGQFLNEAGEIIEGTAVTANRFIPELEEAVAAAGESVVRIPGVEQTAEHAADAEQILLAWAHQMGYRIISIVPAGKPMCSFCEAALQAASDAQLAEAGYPIFFPH